ncbi:AAA family ATPase [Bacillus sp. BHET2]|uniref:AAA family ATPase n=1 Tax=Bacillus sp. BHET2 TaxID=2583818 RepID=UPI001485E43D|nr:AAA family ATPase [Bacillus sp. BHET2]
MIIGVFINGFKSYSQATYVPICDHDKNNFTTIIGQNGVGKSAILEALNFYFRQSPWNENKGEKAGKSKDDKFITPVFLVEKKSINRWLETNPDFKRKAREIISDLKEINSFLWEKSDEYFKGGARKEHTEDFIRYKNRLIAYKDSHYLLTIGKNSEFKTVTNPFAAAFKEVNVDRINSILEEFYNYIYIPTDQVAHETLKIESIQMQKIMNRNVVNKIEEFLNKRLKIEKKTKSFLDHINDELKEFVADINGIIRKVDDSYEFKARPNQKQNIRPSDIVDNILNAYFTKRPLKIAQKEVEHLSSGEQRRAMIDVIYFFLINRGIEEKIYGRNIILAIDEPEVSQDIKHCYEQFERLEKIANDLGNQVILTTHWYGILPVIEAGTLVHISANSKFDSFDFFDYLDKAKHFPEEIQMKSIYELVISLRNYLRVEQNKHLIICEGGTDKRYLETLIDSSKVRIISVGGIDNVRDVYNLLVMGQKYENNGENKKKVLCLTDTDNNARDNTSLIKDPSGKIQLRRLQINNSKDELNLINFTDNRTEVEHSITRIEDVLHVETWIEVIEEILEDENIEFNGYRLLENRKFSKLRGDKSILFAETPDASENKEELIKLLESHKGKMSKQYIKCFNGKISIGELKEVPPIFSLLNEFFKENVLIDYQSTKGKMASIKRLHNVLKEIKIPDLALTR